MRIVLVDDHELLAQSLRVAFADRNVETTIVHPTAPEEVLERLMSLSADLVLLDLHLGPGSASGEELIEPLVAVGQRVVMLTGTDDRIALARCLVRGAQGVIRKSVSFDRLVDYVDAALDGRPVPDVATTQQLRAELIEHQRREQERMSPFASLTPREEQVLGALVEGRSADTIASESYVSIATVRSQIRTILRKLGVHSQLEAVALANARGWPGPVG